ncbi:MAG: SRPBCC family protein [Dehalococcoidia bacterium]|nr:SRPBCC family protein [Dehalococcoidia bacterium]
MSRIVTTVTGIIPVAREPFFRWLVPGVFYDELHTVLRDAAGMPGVQRTSGTTGPWDVPGSHRIVHTTDGYQAREEVSAVDAPSYFSYVVTEFTQPLFRRLVREARGQWWFEDHPAGTRATWTYSFEPTSTAAGVALLPVVKGLWNRYMAAAMKTAARRAEAEVGTLRGTHPVALEALHGPQGMTEEDRAPRGSRYAEVRAALYANPYRGGRSGQEAGPLPRYRSTIRNAWKGLLPGGKQDQLWIASARSIDSNADLRWGPDGKGYRRILSPNGMAVLGTWEITEDTPYTGYFKTGARGLFMGRYSSDGNETKRGERRSLSLAGKIWPTDDPEHPEPLPTASFMSQEDLGGMRTDYINDAELTNEPNVTAYRRGIYILIMLRAGFIFPRLDKVSDARQLYEIAEIGKPEGEPTRAPRFLRLKMRPGQRRMPGDDLDFRDEIYQHLFEPGAKEPTGEIVFDIFVSDDGTSTGIPGFRRVKVRQWQRVGQVTLTEAVASYNADHVIHFRHPGWRTDRDDASTAIRRDEQRVR